MITATFRKICLLITLLIFIITAGAGFAHAQELQAVVGTTVRFAAGSNSVDVIIDQDNPTVRDFLSLLPLQMTLEDFAGREKIGYLARKLAVNGSKGSDPEDGDLIYFVPWGNLGFYYNATGIDYSDQTIHIGKYRATPAQLSRLEHQTVTVSIPR